MTSLTLPVLPCPWGGDAETAWQVVFRGAGDGQDVSLRALAAALFGYGVVSAGNRGRVAWAAFGGLYHFGFLLKILTGGAPLPETKEEFSARLSAFLGRDVYDARYIAAKLPVGGANMDKDLAATAKLLDAPAAAEPGGLWQAGEKSLATCQVFMRTMGLFFAWNGVAMHAGCIYGLH